MKLKDPMQRVTGETALMLDNIRYELIQKHNKRVPKNLILDAIMRQITQDSAFRRVLIKGLREKG